MLDRGLGRQKKSCCKLTSVTALPARVYLALVPLSTEQGLRYIYFLLLHPNETKDRFSPNYSTSFLALSLDFKSCVFADSSLPLLLFW